MLSVTRCLRSALLKDNAARQLLPLTPYPLHRPTAAVAPPARQLPTRLLAAQASNDGKEKSWGERLSDVSAVAKYMVNKAIDAVTGFLPSGATQRQQQGQQRSHTPPPPPPPPQMGLLGGLIGRAVGNLVGAAMKTMRQQIAQSAKDRDAVFSQASARIMQSEVLKRRLGEDIQVSSSISQSVSSMNINGVTSKHITLLVPITGSRGRSATAQVHYTQSAGRQATVNIRVQMPEGDVVTLSGDGEGGGRGRTRRGGGGRGGAEMDGNVIDVEFHDVTKK